MLKKIVICTLLVSFSITTKANDPFTQKLDSIMKLAYARGYFQWERAGCTCLPIQVEFPFLTELLQRATV
jgi:hypothetical protein